MTDARASRAGRPTKGTGPGKVTSFRLAPDIVNALTALPFNTRTAFVEAAIREKLGSA